MKMPKFTAGKKLQATTRRVRAGIANPQKTMEEYDEAEPSMRFSSAFLVVLLLHVTAFGGIWAFDRIKAHRAAPLASITQGIANKLQASVPVQVPPKVEATSVRQAPAINRKETSEKEGIPPVEKPVENSSAIHDSGTVYTTVKGDNPVSIAHHFSVSYDDLLKLNNIDNPKKLQIGQKLRIPTKR